MGRGIAGPYTSSMDRLEQAGLNRAWITRRPPYPWNGHLEGLTCGSTGLVPHQRSDRSRAWAAGADGQTIEGEGDGPIAQNGPLPASTIQ